MTDHGNDCVYVLDDEELMRNTLSAVLESSGFEVNTFASGEDFLESLPDLSPACVMLDVMMKGVNGLQVLGQLRQNWPDAPVVMMSGYADVAMAVKAMQSGASDFIEKPFRSQDILETLERVQVSSPASDDRGAAPAPAETPLDSLTDREMEVLALLVKGKQNKIVARELGISPRTVEVHRARIMQRLEVKSFADLVRLYVLSGLTID